MLARGCSIYRKIEFELAIEKKSEAPGQAQSASTPLLCKTHRTSSGSSCLGKWVSKLCAFFFLSYYYVILVAIHDGS